MIECCCGNLIDKVVECGGCGRVIQCTTAADDMTFFNLVRELRLAQKEYFKTKRPDVLSASMKLEKQVDKMIDDKVSGQMELF